MSFRRGFGERPEGEAFPRHPACFGVDVLGLPDVDGDGEAGIYEVDARAFL